MTELRTARAADKPCALYRYHAPQVVRTQGHHTRPVYLQNRVYGRIQDPDLMWLCGSCHDAVHEGISWMLGEARKPEPMPGRLALAEARRTVAWYQAALAAKATA